MKPNEFEKSNPDLPDTSVSGVMIYIRELATGYLRIAIDVDEFVTSAQLRGAIPLALKWRDRLTKAQGYTGLGSDNAILRVIDSDLLSNTTYQHVAIAINQIVAEWLYESLGIPKPAIKIKSPYKDNLNRYLDGIDMRIPDPIERVRKILYTMRLNKQEIIRAIESGLEALNLGEYPFQDDYPVSKRKLISVMKWWRK